MSEPLIFDVESNIANERYRALLDYALGICDTFLLVIRNGQRLDGSGLKVLERLSKFLIRRSQESEWPGTKLLYGGTAVVHRYRFEKESCEILERAATSLFHWRQPLLPEDLTLFQRSGAPWLVTVAHEKWAYFEITEAEFDCLTKALPGIERLVRRRVS